MRFTDVLSEIHCWLIIYFYYVSYAGALFDFNCIFYSSAGIVTDKYIKPTYQFYYIVF